MQQLLKMKNKGLSIVVAYVMLIVMALSLSILVYSWLKGNIIKPEKECPEISLIIENYSCSDNQIRLLLKNNGRFSINGVIVKTTKSEGLAITEISPPGGDFFTPTLNPGNKIERLFDYKEEIKKIEIIPLKEVGGERLICDKGIINQKITC